MNNARLAATAMITMAGLLLTFGDGLNRFEFIGPAGAQGTPQSVPMQMKLEFDNDAMSVVRVRLAPRQQTPMHELSARLVIWLTDAQLRDTMPDGTTTDYRRSAGQLDWVPAQRHAGENFSDQAIEFLAVIPKAAPSASSAGAPHNHQ